MTELVLPLRMRVVRPLVVAELKEPHAIPWLMRDACNQIDTPIKGNLLTHEEPIEFTYDTIKS